MTPTELADRLDAILAHDITALNVTQRRAIYAAAAMLREAERLLSTHVRAMGPASAERIVAWLEGRTP